jgi:hypothetical protein
LFQDQFKQGHELVFAEKLARTAQGRVPGKFLIQIVADEVKDIHPHTGGSNDTPVAVQVFQITHQHQFHENYRVYAFLTLAAIILRCGSIQKIEVEYTFELSVEIVLRDIIRKLEPDKQLFLVIFFPLHDLNLIKSRRVKNYLFSTDVSCATVTLGRHFCFSHHK